MRCTAVLEPMEVSSFGVIKRCLIRFGMNSLLQQENGPRLKVVLRAYYKARRDEEWTFPEKEDLFELMYPIIDLLTQSIDAYQDDDVILMLKSSLIFISEDFPELAETILYSPLMEQLDEDIDSWNPDGPEFDTVDELYKAMNEMNQLFDRNQSHSWWNHLGLVSMVDGRPVQKAIRKCRGENIVKADRNLQDAREDVENAQKEMDGTRSVLEEARSVEKERSTSDAYVELVNYLEWIAKAEFDGHPEYHQDYQDCLENYATRSIVAVPEKRKDLVRAQRTLDRSRVALGKAERRLHEAVDYGRPELDWFDLEKREEIIAMSNLWREPKITEEPDDVENQWQKIFEEQLREADEMNKNKPSEKSIFRRLKSTTSAFLNKHFRRGT